MTTPPSPPPAYTNFITVMEDPLPLLQWVIENPLSDHIYQFDCRKNPAQFNAKYPPLPPLDNPKMVFSGSAAVKYASEMLEAARLLIQDYSPAARSSSEAEEKRIELEQQRLGAKFHELTGEDISSYDENLSTTALNKMRNRGIFASKVGAFDLVLAYRGIRHLPGPASGAWGSHLQGWKEVQEGLLAQIRQDFRHTTNSDIAMFLECDYSDFGEDHLFRNDIDIINPLALLEKYKAVKAIQVKTSFVLSWKPNDIDLFFLDSPEESRQSQNGLDFVRTKEKTPADLLINFDLACCRAAYTEERVFWISSHCLFGLITGYYFLPRYLSQANLFTSVLEAHRLPNLCKSQIGRETYHVTRMMERISRYRVRGFVPLWVDSDFILPWIKNRFQYADFSEETIQE